MEGLASPMWWHPTQKDMEDLWSLQHCYFKKHKQAKNNGDWMVIDGWSGDRAKVTSSASRVYLNIKVKHTVFGNLEKESVNVE